MRSGYQVIENFCPEADAMRAAFERHCADPENHTAEVHQVWNYWFVPDTYCYLRTDPDRVLGRALADKFFARLAAEGFERWGLSKTYTPYLSCYVAGCYQSLHNDFLGGRLGYVYSLTHWDKRRFDGGETLIFREESYFGSPLMTRAAAATNFYDLIPARFNQLLVFDDRLPHAVPRIEGHMDPVAGRLVLHGHFEEGGITVEGARDPESAVATLEDVQKRLQARAAGNYHGLLTARIWVGEDGRVRDVAALLDRVLPAKPYVPPFDTQEALRTLRKIDFTASDGESRITIPLAFTL